MRRPLQCRNVGSWPRTDAPVGSIRNHWDNNRGFRGPNDSTGRSKARNGRMRASRVVVAQLAGDKNTMVFVSVFKSWSTTTAHLTPVGFKMFHGSVRAPRRYSIYTVYCTILVLSYRTVGSEVRVVYGSVRDFITVGVQLPL